MVSAKNIYHLPRQFYEENWHAIPCILARMHPTGTLESWPANACYSMQAIIKGKEGWIQIRGTADDGTAAVQLTVRTEARERDVSRASEATSREAKVKKEDCDTLSVTRISQAETSYEKKGAK